MTLLVEGFISKVCNDLRKAVESASEVTLEGVEKESSDVFSQDISLMKH
jgi:hypothetical protein